MTTVRILPGAVRGTALAPPSKSYTHRALIAAHLAARRYLVLHPLDADDTRATARALRRLGSRVRWGRTRWEVRPVAAESRARATIQCGESGTTLRFVAALAASSARPVRLVGRGRLPSRPMAELVQALRELGARCRFAGGAGRLPLDVEGPIHGGAVRLDASRSSQFASALLLTLPSVPGDSVLRLTGAIVSEPYLDATLAVVRRHGVRIDRRGRTFVIPGSQRYHGDRFDVPGDASSAAYLWAAAAVTGGEVRVRGIPSNWPQADLAVLDLLERAGANVERVRDGATVRGRARRGFALDLTGAPDLYPLAAVVAATVPARSRLRGAPHVVHKESDRRAGAVRLARALGAEVEANRREVRIQGTRTPSAVEITDLDDHRLVMSAAVGALAGGGPSDVGDARAVAKSFPGFWVGLAALGGRIDR